MSMLSECVPAAVRRPLGGGGFSAALLAAAAGLVGGPAGARALAGETVAVPIGGRTMVFELDAADGMRVGASRLDARPAEIVNRRIARVEGQRVSVLERGWSLSDRVLVRASGPDALAAALAGEALDARRAPGMPGWYTVEAGSVTKAAALATRLAGAPGIGSAEVDATMPIALRSLPNDPLLSSQWHLVNTQVSGRDARAEGAWSLGYTGAGVTICIVESDGFDLDHQDLAPNVDLSISQPGGFESSHMTNVAGVAAARGGNGEGVTGMAYNARLSQAIIGSTFQTAAALLRFNDQNDVKNNSWGPFDNGRIDPMPSAIADALESAALDGRGGLGTVIVWAGGNGNFSSDRVDYDPYASSRYTVAVAAVGDDDVQAGYSEPGASLLVSAYSDGGARRIVTTQRNGGYNFNFGGTSAASPLAAGVVALMLEANPSLTWRDVQHILVETARPVSLADERWSVNGAGRLVNEGYGFGMVDAEAAVIAAESWQTVEPEFSVSSGVVPVNAALPDFDFAGVERTVTIDRSVRVESVELIVNAQTPFIGDLDISIVSPDGTRSQFARARSTDSQDDLVNTVFTSMRHFGEDAAGTWTVRLADGRQFNEAFWQDFELRVHGVDLGPGPCAAADVARPYGELDLIDLSAFVVAYLANEPSADFAPPFGVFDEKDISGYVQAFLNGCNE